MTIKERIENNLTIWMLGILLSGFLAGLGAYRGIIEIARLEVVPKGSTAKQYAIEGNVEGNLLPELKTEIQKLTEAHNSRLQVLHTKLLDAEKEATNHVNLDSVQDKYRLSAERISKEIRIEHEGYAMHLQALRQLNVKK